MADVMFFRRQEDFADWIEANTGAVDVWVGYHKSGTEKPGVSWSQAVDVALCFGWIDGIRKSIDEHSYKIRFTPRKKGSVWSAVNVRKVETLIERGRMKPAGLALFLSRKNASGYSSMDRHVPLDKSYEDQIKANPPAWKFFSNLAPSYKRDSIWWVMSAKREATRLKRLSILIAASAAGQRIPLLQNRNGSSHLSTNSWRQPF